MVTSYRTVARGGSADLEVNRSRFRCTVARVEDEVGARAVVDRCRKDHWDARHHCSAFVLGPGRDLERSSDDGEPPGTAGAPMLEVLRGRGLSDVVVVVTRWFGGVLLGTGGLARAYAEAARAGLDEAGERERVLQAIGEVSADHARVGRLEHALRARGATVLGVEYADQAVLRLALTPRAWDTAEAAVAELTEGESSLARVGEQWVDR
ncbi:MAG TPA: YigZ family protein [Marmoricola sp.]|nr:YigZ family protein [Marmoricola sp.]